MRFSNAEAGGIDNLRLDRRGTGLEPIAACVEALFRRYAWCRGRAGDEQVIPIVVVGPG